MYQTLDVDLWPLPEMSSHASDLNCKDVPITRSLHCSDEGNPRYKILTSFSFLQISEEFFYLVKRFLDQGGIFTVKDQDQGSSEQSQSIIYWVPK